MHLLQLIGLLGSSGLLSGYIDMGKKMTGTINEITYDTNNFKPVE